VNCTDVRTLIGGYVLHALEPGEADLVRAHIGSCPDCSREHADLDVIPALLDAAHDPDATPAEPPASLEDAVLDRFAREHPRAEGTEAEPSAAAPARRGGGRRRLRAPAWLTRPLPVALVAATVAVAATLAVTGALSGDGGGDGPKVYGAHLRAAAGGASGQGTGPAPAGGERPYAYAKLSTSDSGTRVELKASGLGAQPGAVYELWCVYPDGKRVSGGTFRADPDGRARATMTTAARVGDYHHLTVEERRPGKPDAKVLAGDIAY
jgi:hypothetical protein